MKGGGRDVESSVPCGKAQKCELAQCPRRRGWGRQKAGEGGRGQHGKGLEDLDV